MINLKQWGIRRRVMFLAFAPAILITAILSIYFVKSRIDDLHQSLQARGIALAKHLSPASEFALLTGNHKLLQSLADSATKENDVLQVSIHDIQSSITVIASPPSNSNLGLVNDELLLKTPKLKFTQVVYAGGFEVFDYTEEFIETNSQDRPAIGRVVVIMSQQPTLVREQEILYTSLVIMIGGLLLSVLLALAIGGSVTQPVMNLTRMGKLIRQGQLNARVKNVSGGEIGELEQTINDMAASLEASHNSMLERVDSATRELRDTVSELEIKNQELEVAREEAENAGEAKGDFLAKMSHELRTPMNAVIGFTNLLFSTSLTENQQEYTRTIKRSAIQLLTILDDVLNFSKLESGSIQLENVRFDLQQSLEDVICMLAPAANEKDLELVLLLHSDIPQFVEGDPARLCQILTNLVNNAIKFTHKGSVVVQVSLLTNTEENSVVNPSQNSDTEEAGKAQFISDYLNIEVKDSGIGIETAKIHDLFSDFTQADSSITRRFGGTGLGLTIAKRFVELIGGNMGVDSTVNQGSTFWFTFPCVKEDKSDQCQLSVLSKIKVLVVDSHAISRRAIRNNLIRWGATVFAVGELSKGLELLHNNAKAQPFNLLVLGVNGDEFRKLENDRALFKQVCVPILMLVGSEDFSIAGKASNLQPLNIMGKPFRRDTLYRNVCSLLNIDSNSSEEIIIDDVELRRGKKELRGIKVLVAEDNEFNRTLVETLLTQHGAEVTVANNGVQAVDHAVKARFDIVFMDIHMPELNGIEAVKSLRGSSSRNQYTPIIALTADVFVHERNNLRALGFDKELLKPISEASIVDTVSEYVNCLKNDDGVSEENQMVNTVHVHNDFNLPSHLKVRYLEEIPKYVNAINRAHGENDRQGLIDSAHVLNGLAGYFNQHAFSKCAKSLEQAARDKLDVSEHVQILNQLYQTLSKTTLSDHSDQ